jgi:hypothetical protein
MYHIDTHNGLIHIKYYDYSANTSRSVLGIETEEFSDRYECAATWALLAEPDSVIDIGARTDSFLIRMKKETSASRLIFIDKPKEDSALFTSNGIERVEINLESETAILKNVIAHSGETLILLLDVLEHIENKNNLLRTLLTLRSKLILSLPNTQNIHYLTNFVSGNLSKQYLFDVEDNCDRHRWVTYYAQNIHYIQKFATAHNYTVQKYGECYLEGGKALPRFLNVSNQIFLLIPN